MDASVDLDVDFIPKLHQQGRIAERNDLGLGSHSDILLEKPARFPNKNEPICVKIIAREKENPTVVTVQAVSERELVTSAQNGDRNAFSELVRVHAQGVRNVIYRMCEDVQLAEDAAQETFIRAWQNLSSYRPQTPLRNWLYRIAVNAGMDMLRKEKRILPDDIEDLHLTDGQNGLESLVSQQERMRLVQKAILSLPDASRAIIVLREYEGLSYQEISSTLDIPVGTVMSRLNYARNLLKAKLQPQLSLLEVEHV
jgi:RNA polymerase sigma-70 factor (ECF subfamily)